MKQALKYLAISHLLKYGLLILYPIVILLAALEMYGGVALIGAMSLGLFIANVVYDVKFITRALKNAE